MDHLPLDLPSVGYFLFAQVELGKKDLQHHSSIWPNQTPQDISHKASDFQLHSLGAPRHLKKQSVLMCVCLPWAGTLLGGRPCNCQILFWLTNEGKRQIFPLFPASKGSRLGLSMPFMMTQYFQVFWSINFAAKNDSVGSLISSS